MTALGVSILFRQMFFTPISLYKAVTRKSLLKKTAPMIIGAVFVYISFIL